MTAAPGLDAPDIASLLDDVVLDVQTAAGRNPALMAAHHGAARAIAAARARGPRLASMVADVWTAAERDYLARYAGVLGDEEIAARLGRSRDAIKVRRTRAGLPGPTTHPDYLTGHQIARALGVDGHTVAALIERGLLPAEVAPLRDRHVWRMRRRTFVAWAVNPLNWPYFWRSVRLPVRLGDAALRRLIIRRRAGWVGPDGRADEWLTPSEVAALHGVHHTDVNRYVNAGRLSGVKWGNWLIRRSEATRPGLRFHKGKGGTTLHRYGTPDGDAFLILAAAVGIPAAQINRLMGKSNAWTRLASLCRQGHVPWIIRAFGLPVCYRQSDHALWADWRDVAHRFPRLARVWARAATGAPWKRAEMLDNNLVNGALRAAVRWHMAGTAEGERLLHGLTYRARAAEGEAWALWHEWYGAGAIVEGEGHGHERTQL